MEQMLLLLLDPLFNDFDKDLKKRLNITPALSFTLCLRCFTKREASSSLSIFQSPRKDYIKLRFVCLVSLDVISRSPLFLSFCFSLLRRFFLFVCLDRSRFAEECLELLPNPVFPSVPERVSAVPRPGEFLLF